MAPRKQSEAPSTSAAAATEDRASLPGSTGPTALPATASAPGCPSGPSFRTASAQSVASVVGIQNEKEATANPERAWNGRAWRTASGQNLQRSGRVENFCLVAESRDALINNDRAQREHGRVRDRGAGHARIR